MHATDRETPGTLGDADTTTGHNNARAAVTLGDLPGRVPGGWSPFPEVAQELRRLPWLAAFFLRARFLHPAFP